MMTYLTVDAGIAVKLLVPHPSRQRYVELVTQWQQRGFQLCAPTLWIYEVTSTFARMAHFSHLSAATSRQSLQLAYQLDIQLIKPDEEQALRALTWTERLQRPLAYDSFYLALAETLTCEFWTTDRKLANAVSQSWVKLVEGPV
jgi:predicted nucleic acid-binding protein